MINDSAINEVVEADVAKHKEQNTNGNQQQNQQQTGEPSEVEKAALLLKEQETAAETEKQQLADKEKEDAIVKRLLGELGADSVESLKEKLSKKDQKVLTKEEKEKEDEIYEAKLKLFAVEKGEMKGDDFDQLKTIKSKKDAELVFPDFLETWKEENPEVVVDENTTQADIDQMIKDDFEKEYKLNSKSDKVKAAGIARMAKEAAEKRSPLEESYNSAKERFDNENEIREIFPSFVKGIDGIINELVPEKVEWFKDKESKVLDKEEEIEGEEEIPVEVPLSKEDREEIQSLLKKKLENPGNLQLFKEGKTKEIKESIQEYAEYLIDKKARIIGNKAVAATFMKRGMEKGSNVGATNSFSVNQSKQSATEKTTKSKADVDKEVLDQFGRKT